MSLYPLRLDGTKLTKFLKNIKLFEKNEINQLNPPISHMPTIQNEFLFKVFCVFLFYMILGGIPYYLDLFNPSLSHENKLSQRLVSLETKPFFSLVKKRKIVPLL